MNGVREWRWSHFPVRPPFSKQVAFLVELPDPQSCGLGQGLLRLLHIPQTENSRDMGQDCGEARRFQLQQQEN